MTPNITLLSFLLLFMAVGVAAAAFAAFSGERSQKFGIFFWKAIVVVLLALIVWSLNVGKAANAQQATTQTQSDVFSTRAPSVTEAYPLSVYVFLPDDMTKKLECDRKNGTTTGFDKNTQSRDLATVLLKNLAGESKLDSSANKVTVTLTGLTQTGGVIQVRYKGKPMTMSLLGSGVEFDLMLEGGQGNIVFEDRSIIGPETIAIVKPDFGKEVRYPACTGRLTTGKGELMKLKSPDFVMVTR